MINHPIFPSLINFTVLLLVLIVLLRKPLKGFLTNRSDQLSKELTESEKLRDQAQALLAEYQTKMDQLDGQVEEILTKAKQDGQQLRDEILQRAQQQAEQTMENAKQAADNQAQAMVESLQKEIMNQALAKATEQITKSADASHHDQYVNQFMNELKRGFDGRIS